MAAPKTSINPKARPRTKTEEKTLRGRPVWVDNTGEVTGEKGAKYSEVTTTIPWGTEWITAPSIDENGKRLSDNEVKQRLLKTRGKDFITGEELPTFSNPEKASEYAQWRSDTMFDQEAIEQGFPEEFPMGPEPERKDFIDRSIDKGKDFLEYLTTPSKHGVFNEGGDVAAQMQSMLPSADDDTRSTKEFLQHPLETVPYFQRPMGSSTDDPQVGQDDTGNPVFKGSLGEYTVRVNPDQRTLRTKVEEAIPVVKKAVGDYLEDPKLPTKDQLSEFAKQAGQSAVESVEDLGDLMFKGKGTLGDVFAVAAGAGAASVPFDVPKGALRIFGGVNAEGAYEDKNLKKAVRLLKEADVDPTNVQESYFKNKKIWEQTGWYVDPKDGQWRFEIDDSKSKLKDFKNVFNTELEPTSPAIDPEKSKNFFNEIGNVELSKEDGKYRKLSQVFDHEDFYKRYPDLKDIDVIFYSNPRLRTLLGSASDDEIFINLSAYDNYEDIKSTLLHELQHVIQHEEGFVPGSSQAAVSGELLEAKTKELEEKKRPLVIKEAVLKKELESPVEGEEKLNLIKKLIKVSNEIYAIDEENFKSDYEFYRGAGGEIESRLVQRRADLSSDQRGPQNIAGGFPLDDRVDMLQEEGGKFQYTGSAGVDPYAYQISPRVEPDPEKPGFLSGVKKKLGLTSDSAVDRPKDFNKGGAVMNKQMEMAFMQQGGLKDDGMRQDPVSGNQVPSGSMASEVRDDIPAQLSEGEYVVPADVVRFFGVKFFEDLRSEAKMGLQSMEANGRIGGEPVPMETGELSDEEFARLLQQELGGTLTTQNAEPIKAAQGTYVPGQMSSFNPDNYGLGFSLTPGYTPPAAVGTEPVVETEASCAARGMVYNPETKLCEMPTPVVEINKDGEGEDEGEDSTTWMDSYDYTNFETLAQQTSEALDGPTTMLGSAAELIFGGGVLGKFAKASNAAQVAANIAVLEAQGKDVDALKVKFNTYVNNSGLGKFKSFITGSELAKQINTTQVDVGLFKDSTDVFGNKIFKADKDWKKQLEKNAPKGMTYDPTITTPVDHDDDDSTPPINVSGGYTRTGSLAPTAEEIGSIRPGPRPLVTKPTLTTTEKYERDQARESASSDRIDRQRNEQRIRDIVSGAIQPKDIDEEREFAGVKAAMTGWDE